MNTPADVHCFKSGETNSANEPGKGPMADIFIDFCFEDSDLKVSDIRLDGGSSSQKNNGM